MTARNTWKQGERRVAKFFGTKRVPLSGSNSGHTASDTMHHRLFIEVKHRARHAIRTLYDKTKALAKKEDKIPMVCLIDKNRPGFLICIHSDDWDEARKISAPKQAPPPHCVWVEGGEVCAEGVDGVALVSAGWVDTRYHSWALRARKKGHERS